jgi:hypothetical protein
VAVATFEMIEMKGSSTRADDVALETSGRAPLDSQVEGQRLIEA